MTDIVERLKKHGARMGTRNPKDYTAFLTVEEATEAADEIERLREALKSIGYDYVELSHEKVQLEYIKHINIARAAYDKSSPRKSAIFDLKKLNDDF